MIEKSNQAEREMRIFRILQRQENNADVSPATRIKYILDEFNKPENEDIKKAVVCPRLSNLARRLMDEGYREEDAFIVVDENIMRVIREGIGNADAHPTNQYEYPLVLAAVGDQPDRRDELQRLRTMLQAVDFLSENS